MFDGPYYRLAWLALASLAGAITALSFRPFKDMTRLEIVIALFVGFSFAVFVGPWAVKAAFGSEQVDLRVAGGMFYLMASGSNILVPLAVRKFGDLFGVKAATGEHR